MEVAKRREGTLDYVGGFLRGSTELLLDTAGVGSEGGAAAEGEGTVEDLVRCLFAIGTSSSLSSSSKSTIFGLALAAKK